MDEGRRMGQDRRPFRGISEYPQKRGVVVLILKDLFSAVGPVQDVIHNAPDGISQGSAHADMLPRIALRVNKGS